MAKKRIVFNDFSFYQIYYLRHSIENFFAFQQQTRYRKQELKMFQLFFLVFRG